MKKAFVVLFVLAISFASVAQTTEGQQGQKRSLFAGREKYGWIEGKAGRAFLQAAEGHGDAAQVFYGGAGVGFGVVINNTKVGIGAAFECVDENAEALIQDKMYSFPVFIELRQYFGRDSSHGFFVGAKGGWALGGKRSYPVQKTLEENEILQGNFKVSTQGPYVEAMVGYHFRQFDFFVAYDYRAVKFEKYYIYGSNATANYDESWKRNMHAVMGGLSFRLF